MMKTFDESIIIGEEDFSEKMEAVVKPWMQQHLQDGFLQSFDGRKLHYYYALCPEEKGSIVMSHGFCEFAGKYHELMYYFYQMGYSVFFVEYRGHGLSERDPQITEPDKVHVRDFMEYVKDLHSFVEQVVREKSLSHRYWLFGHSMGGCVAALYLETYPDVFQKAVLSSPMLQMNFGKFSDWQVSLLMAWSRLARWDLKYAPGQRGFDGTYAYATSSSISQARYDYMFRLRQQEPLYSSYGGTYGWVRASVKAIDLVHKQAKKITIPVLLFQAGKDTMVKLEGQDAFIKETPHSRMVVFEDCKHEIFNGTLPDLQKYCREIFSFFGE
jgi:lysophospholipase